MQKSSVNVRALLKPFGKYMHFSKYAPSLVHHWLQSV